MKKNTKKQPAVFLDRDGTLIEEVNYLSRVEDLRLFPFTANAVRLLKENGFLVIVVTNQSGIGRGIFDEASMHAVHEKIQSELSESDRRLLFLPASALRRMQLSKAKYRHDRIRSGRF